MNLDTLEKMCRALECQPGDVLKMENNKKNGKKPKTKSKLEK